MTHGSLFSGVGGFDLAAQWMGWENAFHCEINPFGRHVLNYYWPNAKSYEDITKTDFTVWRGRIDVLTGGFPCQPFSLAGKRKGTEDERHLWPEMLRAIREIEPRWIVGENVFGLVNWDGGLVFEQVQADLENEGYEVQPYILPAAGVNAPHRRDRIWFVAHSIDSDACGASGRHEGASGKERIQERDEVQQSSEPGVLRDAADSDHVAKHIKSNCGSNGEAPKSFRPEQETGQPHRRTNNFGHDTDTKSKRLEGATGVQNQEARRSSLCSKSNGWQNFPTQPPVRSRDDGIPPGLAGITVSKHRNESIKAYGNAIVPQIALQIFKAISEYEKL